MAALQHWMGGHLSLNNSCEGAKVLAHGFALKLHLHIFALKLQLHTYTAPWLGPALPWTARPSEPPFG
eukprot:7921478-Prorocentrum_lima.AAC.1